MPNKRIAELISNGLRQGLVHPGRDGGPPTPVVVPGFRTAGMPPEMAELMNETAVLIGEAIVALIEESSEIVDKEKAVEWRIADENAPRRQIAVYDRGDRARVDPMFILTVTNNPYILVNEKQLFKGLEERANRRTR